MPRPKLAATLSKEHEQNAIDSLSLSATSMDAGFAATMAVTAQTHAMLAVLYELRARQAV